MKKNNKIGLLLAVMVLGACNLSDRQLYAQPATEGVIITAKEIRDNSDSIKANRETLENAQAEMENKNYEAAIQYLDAYISGKPKKYEGYKLRGKCYYALRKYELARDDFQKAVDIKTADDRFITGTKIVGAVVLGADKNDQYQNPELGLLYGDLMYAQKALNDPAYEESYKKAFQYNSHMYLPQPKATDIFRINCPQKYGKIFNPQGNDADIAAVVNDIEKGDFHEAAYKLPNLASNLPKYYLTHYLTGVVMAGLEHEKEAINAFEKAIKLNPDDFESYASLGKIYYDRAEKTFSKEDADKSIEYFKKAMLLNPNLSTYDYYIGLNQLLVKDYDSAISSFNKAIELRGSDYNSMYYRAIAQQIKGDYNPVIEGTTKLLNKHVSNYNSVLYLRALANYKLNNQDLALEDIDKIFAGMNDLHNADIKTVSAKEATLEEYLHYLRGQILSQKNEDSADEFEKAYQNLIIKSLASGEYYNIEVDANDLENQIDYIKTTFSDYGNIIPSGNEYRMTNDIAKAEQGLYATPVMKTEASVKPPVPTEGKKLLKTESVVDLTPSIAQELALQTFMNKEEKSEGKQEAVQTISQETPTLRQPSASEESLPNINDSAKVQASVMQSAPDSEGVTAYDESAVKVSGSVKTGTAEVAPSVSSDSTVVSAPIQKAAENIDTKYKDEIKPAVDEKISQVSDIIAQQKDITLAAIPKEALSSSVASVAKEVKEAPEVKVSYENRVAESLQNVSKIDEAAQQAAQLAAQTVKDTEAAAQEAVKTVQDVAQTAQETVTKAPTVILPDLSEQVEKVSKPVQVTEKFAQVDLSKFNVNSQLPTLKPGDEVILFEPQSDLFNRKQTNSSGNSTELNSSSKITDNFSQIHKLVKETVETVSDTQETSDKIVKQAEQKAQESSEAVNKAVENVSDAVKKSTQEVKKEIVNTPELVVPEEVIRENDSGLSDKVSEISETAPKIRVQSVDADQNVSKALADVAAPKFEEQTEKSSVAESKDEQWLKDILDKAAPQEEETVSKKVKKQKKEKVKQEESLDEFINEYDEVLVKNSKEKSEKRRSKKQTKEEERVASILQQTISGDETDIAQKKENDVAKRSDETVVHTQERGAITVLEKDTLFKKKKDKSEKTKRKFLWFKRKKAE